MRWAGRSSVDGMGELTVPAVAFAALAVWSAVLVLEVPRLRGGQQLCEPVREAALVALFIALTLGAVSALGFIQGVLPGGAVQVIAAGWRAGVLACGVYALTGTLRARA